MATATQAACAVTTAALSSEATMRQSAEGETANAGQSTSSETHQQPSASSQPDTQTEGAAVVVKAEAPTQSPAEASVNDAAQRHGIQQGTGGSRSASPVPTVEDQPASSRQKPSTAVPDEKPAHTCGFCPGEGIIQCDSCKTIYYCSAKCQREDEAHKLLCQTWAEFKTAPDESCKRAILFPEGQHEGTVRFVWLKFHQNMDDDGDSYDQPLLGDFLTIKGGRGKKSLTQNTVLWRRLHHMINIVHYAEDFEYVEKNETVANLVDTRFANPWNGTTLVYGTRGKSQDLPKADDLDLQDFRHVLDYFNSYRSTAVSSDMRYFGRTVRGVRINCEGDMVAGTGRKAFEAVRVPVTHKVYQGNTLLPIASKMGIPILSERYPRNSRYDDNIELYESRAALAGKNKQDWNAIARDLQQDWLLDSDQRPAQKAETTLGSPWFDQYYQGTVVMVRKDEKPLYPQQVEALWRYNKYFLEPRMTRASTIHAEHEREKVDQEITKEKFAVYYEHFQTFQSTERERKILSPYEVKKQRGSLKRKHEGFLAKHRKRGRWEWTSDGDDEENHDEESEA